MKTNEYPQCPSCMEHHPKEIRTYKTEDFIRGVHVEYDATSYYCRVADEYFDVDSMISDNFLSLKRAYRIKCGLLTAEEI